MSRSTDLAAYERLVDTLAQHGKVKANGTSAMAQCPAHDDHNPSLALRSIEGQALVYCHAGCDTTDVLTALGLTAADLYDEPKGATYAYDDGRLVFRSPDKKFRQSGNTKGVGSLYRLLGKVRAGIAAGQPVFVVEGEKDVHAIESLGGCATCSPMGAGKWSKVDSTPLHGAKIVVVADDDEAGSGHARDVLESLDGMVPSIQVVHAKVGKDAADHIAAGYGLDDFVPVELDIEVPHRRARITWATEIEPEPVVWAWNDGEGRIPAGSLSIAAGREGTGKSSFGMWLAAQITRGSLPGAFHGTPRAVFYVAVEDSWKHTIVPRLMAAGADLSKVGRFEVVTEVDDEVMLSLPHDNQLLEWSITDHSIALVVIDPLMSVIGDKIDTHREREVRSALDPLSKMADRTGSIFLGIAHFNKGTGTDAASLITGSGAFKNVPRSVFGFARDDSDDSPARVMTQVKNSLGIDGLPSLAYQIETAEIDTKFGIATTGKFTFLGETDRSVQEILREARSDDDQTERTEAADWLKDYLAENGGEAKAGDAIKAAAGHGIAKPTLDRARRRAGIPSVKSGMHGGWVWSIEARRTHEELEGLEGLNNQKVSPSSSSVSSSWEPPPESTPSECPAIEDQVAAESPECITCGQSMLLVVAGRDTCERCRIDRERKDRSA